MLKKVELRERRHRKVRTKVSWNATILRLSVYRSNLNIYAQLIDDEKWVTVCSVSNLILKDKGTKVEIARKVWEMLAEKAIEKKVTACKFDRGGFSYQGRVKALADGARSKWLKF